MNCIHFDVSLVGAKQLIFQSGVLLLQKRPRRSLYAACTLSALPSGAGTPARRGGCVNDRGERYACKQRGGGTSCGSWREASELKDHNLKKRAQQSFEMFLSIQYVGAYHQIIWFLLPPLPSHPPSERERKNNRNERIHSILQSETHNRNERIRLKSRTVLLSFEPHTSSSTFAMSVTPLANTFSRVIPSTYSSVTAPTQSNTGALGQDASMTEYQGME